MIKIIKYIKDYQSSLDFIEDLNRYVINKKEFNSVDFIGIGSREKINKYEIEFNYLSEFNQENNINYLILPINSFIVGKLSFDYFNKNNQGCKQIGKNINHFPKLISSSGEYFDKNYYYDLNWKDTFDFTYPDPPSYPIINYNDKNSEIFLVQFDILKNNYLKNNIIEKDNFKLIECSINCKHKDKIYNKQLYPNKRLNLLSNCIKLDNNKKYHPMYLFYQKDELILDEKESFEDNESQDSNYNIIYFCIFALIFVILLMIAWCYY